MFSDLGLKIKDTIFELRSQGKEEQAKIFAYASAEYTGIEDYLNPV
jgi:hypothetical protein